MLQARGRKRSGKAISMKGNKKTKKVQWGNVATLFSGLQSLAASVWEPGQAIQRWASALAQCKTRLCHAGACGQAHHLCWAAHGWHVRACNGVAGQQRHQGNLRLE